LRDQRDDDDFRDRGRDSHHSHSYDRGSRGGRR
jgi:hypothetical protein